MADGIFWGLDLQKSADSGSQVSSEGMQQELLSNDENLDALINLKTLDNLPQIAQRTNLQWVTPEDQPRRSSRQLSSTPTGSGILLGKESCACYVVQVLFIFQ